MDNEYRLRYLKQMGPWVGFIVAAGALALGLRAIAAGMETAGILGYVAGSVELFAGYVTARRAWNETIDIWFVLGIGAVVLISLFILLVIELPATIFQ